MKHSVLQIYNFEKKNKFLIKKLYLCSSDVLIK